MAEKEIQPKEGPLKEPDAMVKRPYVAPQLHEYGHLADLTQGLDPGIGDAVIGTVAS